LHKNQNFLNKDLTYNFDNLEKNLTKSSVIKERVNLIASHMYKQHLEYTHAANNTTKMFNRLLNDMDDVTRYLTESFSSRGIPSSNIMCEIDADRSVGIINILWHSISFTTRGNTKPQALFREDKPPLFTGRIIALNGDFQDATLDIQDQEYPDILSCEIASLYVPADTMSDAIIKIRHLGNREYHVNQIDAPREFLLKVIEIICGGGFYHESEPVENEDDDF
jgi:hypothetical protein